MILFCAAIKRDLFSLLRFPFVSHINVFPCEITVISLLLFFFPFLLSSFCCFVCSYVASAVIGHCNKSFFALLNILLEILFGSIYTALSAGESSSS